MSKPVANIHPDARIGDNVRVEPFATVGEDVEIGEGTWIGPNAVIMDGARIGKDCKIFPGAVISAIPQDLKFQGEHTTTEIGDNVTIREHVTVNRGTKDQERTFIGSNTLLMAYVHVAHDCHIGSNCVIANSVNLAGHIHLEDHVILEGLVAIQQFIRVGQHAFISGASLVRKNVPPYVKAAREPLTYSGVNTVGLRRRGFEEESIQKIEDIYRLLYIKNSTINTGIQALHDELPDSAYKKTVLDFINGSEKGIMRGPTNASKVEE